MHLRSGVQQGGSPQVLYVSGAPGTGKTAIVLEVLGQLRFESKFHLVHVNAMRLGAPRQIFREIAAQLLREPTSSSLACDRLSQYFTEHRGSDPVVVLLIDEVDSLVTASQAVLYSVFEWLGIPNVRLVIAVISNTMDLPERLLPRVASRFHLERVDFAPYSKHGIYEILCSRLKFHGATDAFSDTALRLCAARFAGASGDVRRALQVCRRAVEIVAQSGRQGAPVSVADFEAADKELVFANPVAQAVAGLNSQTRRFLAAVVIELRRGEACAVALGKAASRLRKLLAIVAVGSERFCKDSGDGALCKNEEEQSVQHMLQRLEALSILRRARPAVTAGTRLPPNSLVISLCSLDVEDLANALLKVEDESIIRDLIEGGRPGAEPRSIYKPID